MASTSACQTETVVAIGPGLGGGVSFVRATATSAEIQLETDPDGRLVTTFGFRASNLVVGKEAYFRCTNAGNTNTHTKGNAKATAATAADPALCWGEGFTMWASYDGDRWFDLASTRFVEFDLAPLGQLPSL